MQLQVLSTVVINSDKSGYTIVASYPLKRNSEYEKIFFKVMSDLTIFKDEKINITYDKFTIHILVGELLYYACLTPLQNSPSDAKKITHYAQKYLDRVRSVYRELPLLADLSPEFNHFFTVDLSAPLETLSKTHNYQEINSLPIIHHELAEVRKILIDSIQKLIDRDHKLDELVKKTQSLEIMIHKDFHRTPRLIKKKRNICLVTIVSITALLSTLVFGIVFYIEVI